MLRKVFFILLAIAISFSIIQIPVSASALDLAYTDSLEEYQASIKDYSLRQSLSVMPASDGNVNYASIFGGSYIDDSNNLVVLLTDLTTDAISHYSALIGTDGVLFRECSASLDELSSLKDAILSCYTANYNATGYDILEQITAVGIYETENKVFVSLKDCSDSVTDEFKSIVLDSEHIVFELGEEAHRQAGFNMSSQISFIDTNSSARIGFRCYKMINGERVDGYVTCGHGNTVGTKVGFANVAATIGTVHSTSFYNMSSSDASFVIPISDLYTVNTTIEGTNYSIVGGGMISLYSTGTTIYFADGSSTMSSGKIRSSSVAFTEGGITTNNLVSASYSSEDGDSGGAVVRLVGEKYYITGIHTGKDGFYAVFSRIDKIIDELDVTLY